MDGRSDITNGGPTIEVGRVCSHYIKIECSQQINRKPQTFVKFRVFLDTRGMSQIIKWTKAICASAGINDGLKLK